MEASLEQQPAGDAPADAPQEAWPPHVPPLHMAGRALAAAAGSVAAALGVGVSMSPYKTGLLACFTSALVVGLSLRGTFSLDTCKLGFVAGLSSAIVGALKLRGTLWAVVLSLAISFVTMIPLRQITFADWFGCGFTAILANVVHAVLYFALRNRASCLTGETATLLHVVLEAALTMWTRGEA